MNRKSKLYRSLRWGYQPVKAAKSLCLEWMYFAKKRAKLAELKSKKDFSGLHVGCGNFYLPEWINTDMLGNPKVDFPLDISVELPLPDASFNVLYGCEVVEHITLEEARLFLPEAYRVLKPGGVIRLTTPDLTEVCKIFLGQKDGVTTDNFGEVWLEGEFSAEIWINAQFRFWGHQHLYTFASLSEEMEAAGFEDVVVCEPNVTKSEWPQLNGLDARYGKDAPSWIYDSTLVVEARKPLD